MKNMATPTMPFAGFSLAIEIDYSNPSQFQLYAAFRKQLLCIMIAGKATIQPREPRPINGQGYSFVIGMSE